MTTFNRQAAQGDILVTKIDHLPTGLENKTAEDGNYVIAHSETGHNHVLPEGDVNVYHAANDPLVLFVVVSSPTSLTHLRSFDTHAPINLAPGIYRINRQREHTPDGWRVVAD